MISKKHSAAARRNLQIYMDICKARQIIKPCETCAKEMRLAPSTSKKRFCSWSCRRDGMVGEKAANFGKGENTRGPKNPNFKGWTPTTRTTGDVGRKFRGRVLLRDGHRCVACGSAGPLNAHHIDCYASFPLFNGDSTNGITLCTCCHKKAHSTTGGYGLITLDGRIILHFGKRKTLPDNGTMRRTAIGTFVLGWK